MNTYEKQKLLTMMESMYQIFSSNTPEMYTRNTMRSLSEEIRSLKEEIKKETVK